MNFFRVSTLLFQENVVPLHKNFALLGGLYKILYRKLWDYYKKNVPDTHSLRSSWHKVFTLTSVR